MPVRYDDHERRREQARRQRIMDGVWREDAYQYLRQLLGTTRVDNMWGGIYAVDTTTNILREDAEGKSTLYDRPPRVRCLVSGEEQADASLLMDQLLDDALWSTLMAEVLTQTIGVNDYCIRYEVLEKPGQPGMVKYRLHPTSPARVVEAMPSEADPRQPAMVVEEWELPDGKPGERVWTETQTWLRNTDGLEVAGTREDHEQGACPWVFYHIHGRPQLWLPYYRSETVESTYRTSMAYSYLDHVLLEASWNQRVTIDLVPQGVDTSTVRDGTSMPEVVGDATTVQMFHSPDEKQGGRIDQWKPGADPEVMGRAVARLHGRATLAAGGSDLAVYRKSGNAESAYAMAITREMQRDAQVAMAPRMQPSDELLVSRLALATNSIIALFPASAVWKVRYHALPPSKEELERYRMALEMGLMSRADLLMAVDPFLTRAEAERQAIQEAESNDE